MATTKKTAAKKTAAKKPAAKKTTTKKAPAKKAAAKKAPAKKVAAKKAPAKKAAAAKPAAKKAKPKNGNGSKHVGLLSHDVVAQRAYQIWMTNGYTGGELDNWLEAERQLRG